MGDADIGREQAHLLLRAVRQGGLRLGEVWLHYFSIGGDVGQLEVEAFLADLILLPPMERDLLAHAVNELLAEREVPRVPYTDEFLQRRTPQEGNPPQSQQRPDQEQRDVRDEDETG